MVQLSSAWANVISAYKGMIQTMKAAEKDGSDWQEEFMTVFKDLEKFGWLKKPNKHWNDILEYLVANLESDAEDYPALAQMCFAFKEVLQVYTPAKQKPHVLTVEYTVDGDSSIKKKREVVVDTDVKLMSEITYFDKKGKAKTTVRDLTDTHPEDIKGHVMKWFDGEGYSWGHYDTEYMSAVFMGMPAMLRMYDAVQKLVRRGEKHADNALVQSHFQAEGTLEKIKKGAEGGYWAQNDRDFKQSVRHVTELMLKGKGLQYKRHMSELCYGVLLTEKQPKLKSAQALDALKEKAILGLGEITSRRTVESCKELEDHPKVKALMTWFSTNPECRDWEEGVNLIAGFDPVKDAHVPSSLFMALGKKVGQERSNVYEGRAYNDNGATVDPDSEAGKELSKRKAKRADRQARKDKMRQERERKLVKEAVDLM